MFCEDCDIDYTLIDGYPTCTNCGNAIMEPQLITEYNNIDSGRMTVKHIHIYKRFNYFNKLLTKLNGSICSYDTEYYILIEKLKKLNKMDIFELKRWLKSNRYNRYTTYIYNIYKLAYGDQLIKLNDHERINVIKAFQSIDRNYRKLKHRNQLNYNFIFYKIFQKYGLDNSNIILPRTIHKLEQIMKQVFD